MVRRVRRRGSGAVPAAGNRGERILAGCDALHHLLEVQLVQRGGAEFPPRARRGHRGPEPAAQRVRHDGGLGRVVLAPVHQHLAGAQGLFHVADGQIRVVGFERAGQFAGEVGNLVRALGPVQGRVEVDALAAARHRHGIQADVLQDGAGQPGHLHALRQSRALARVQVQHQPVRRRRVAVGVHPPLRHVDLQGCDLGQPGEGGGIVDQGVLDGPVLVRDGGPGHPAGRRMVQVLLEEHLPGASAVPTPWTQRFRVAGRLRAAGISTGATAA